MSDYNDDFYNDDYRWDVDNGYIDERGGGSVGDFHVLRTFFGGLLLLSIIFSLFSIDIDGIPSFLFLLLVGGACWLWTKIRKAFKG